MRKQYLLISGAWLLHAVAWFLPVVKGEVTFPHALPITQMGFEPAALPDFAHMTAITFVDTVLSHETFTDRLLFHELVHVVQYKQLGMRSSRRRM